MYLDKIDIAFFNIELHPLLECRIAKHDVVSIASLQISNICQIFIKVTQRKIEIMMNDAKH